jgi:hypothetical protein
MTLYNVMTRVCIGIGSLVVVEGAGEGVRSKCLDVSEQADGPVNEELMMEGC